MSGFKAIGCILDFHESVMHYINKVISYNKLSQLFNKGDLQIFFIIKDVRVLPCRAAQCFNFTLSPLSKNKWCEFQTKFKLEHY